MFARTEFSKVNVPVNSRLINAHLVAARDELVIVFFTLASAHKFARTRNFKVNGRNRLAIWVDLHIVCLDVFWPVFNKHRAAKVFSDIFFVFFGNIFAVFRGKLPLNWRLFQNVNNVFVVNTCKLA